jgi:hypothetical protein
MVSQSKSLLAFGAFALGACASTPGAKPSDMSMSEHQQAAAAHEGEADPHLANYDPNAKQTRVSCEGRLYASSGACWTSVTNPTDQHRADADKHRKMAADHRAAAEALRSAEAQACSGLKDEDRDMSPFNHREDITSVTPASMMVPPGAKSQTSQVVGATVGFRAVPGLTAEWLQRIVDCHIARNNALGNNMPEMSYCPLVPKGVSAKVTSTGNGFAVTIQSNDPAGGQEVLRRAQALKSGS